MWVIEKENDEPMMLTEPGHLELAIENAIKAGVEPDKDWSTTKDGANNPQNRQQRRPAWQRTAQGGNDSNSWRTRQQPTREYPVYGFRGGYPYGPRGGSINT